MQLNYVFSAIWLATSCSQVISQAKPCPTIETNVSDPRFKPGQVWTYTTRPNEPSSTLTILQVDRAEKTGIIIHIRVDGLYAHNPRGERVPSIEHMPFTRDAILTSTDHLLRLEKQLPTLEGYERWHHDCGGVYTISIRDAIDVMEKTLNAP
jgi:hypothetical protein